MGQYIALGGVAALLAMLLRVIQRYITTITNGAIERASQLNERVSQLEGLLDRVRTELRTEQHRCDGLQREVELLKLQKERISMRVDEVDRRVTVVAQEQSGEHETTERNGE